MLPNTTYYYYELRKKFIFTLLVGILQKVDLKMYCDVH